MTKIPDYRGNISGIFCAHPRVAILTPDVNGTRTLGKGESLFRSHHFIS